jgi:protein SCO1/2
MLRQLLHRMILSCVTAEEPPRILISDKFADAKLTNQFGQSVQFRKRFVEGGRAMVINTMYTTCRGSCPGTSEVIESLREKLSPVFGDRLSFVSLSIDPTVDTPEKLRRYARIYGAGESGGSQCEWQFLTGSPTEVDALRRSLGFYDLNPKVDQDITQHASTLMFGNTKTDRWATMPSELSETQLVTTIRRVAGFTFEQKYGITG